MSTRKVHGRVGSRKPFQRDATAIEAAYIMQSYLVENRFTRTLAEFRSEASAILSSFKKGKETPQGVKSLTTVLRDYVALGNELEASREENRKLQAALKHGADALQGLYKFYETMMVSQTGCPPHYYPVQHHPLLSLETQPQCPSAPAGPGPIPCSPNHPGLKETARAAGVTAPPVLSLKRKSSVALMLGQGSATNNSTEAPAAAKRACQRAGPPSGLPKRSTPSSASGPTCPGEVRKVNRVRNNAPAKVLFDEEKCTVKSPTTSPPLELPNCPMPEAKSSSSEAPALTEPQKHSRDGPHTPPQSSPQQQLLPENGCSTDDPGLPHKGRVAMGSAASSTGPSLDLHADQDDLLVNREGSAFGLPSPSSRLGTGTRGTKMSKMMRPLDFVLPPTVSNVPEADHVSRNDMMGDNMLDLSADLQPIDDILNSLHDQADLDSLGDLLHSSCCTEDALPSSVRSRIGEDSFGFDCLFD